MSVYSEMSQVEMEIRGALAMPPGDAIRGLLESYHDRDDTKKDSFVAAMIGHFVLRGCVPSKP